MNINCSGDYNQICTGQYDGRNYCVDNSLPYICDNPNNVCVIYAISGICNNVSENTSLYIGSTKNHYVRNCKHFSELRKKQHFNSHLQNSWNKYGEENFKIIVLEHCEINDRKIREQNWIDYYNASFTNHKVLFNIENVVDKSEISEETRLKFVENSSGKNNPMYGKNHTEETKNKISQVLINGKYIGENNKNYGSKRSEESKKNMSKSRIKMLKIIKHPWIGRKHKESSKQKISDANGKPVKQFDRNTGKLIKIWDNAVKVEENLKIDTATIYKVCLKQKYKSGSIMKNAGGYYWEYTTKEELNNWKNNNE